MTGREAAAAPGSRRTATRRRRRHGARPGSRTGTQRAFAFVVAAALPLYLAFSGGGYDVVLRHEAALILWWGLAAALLFGVLPAARPPAEARLPLLGLLALVAWTALALLWTESRERSVEELARVVGYAGLVTLILAALHRDTWRRAASGLALAMLALPVVALVSRLAPELYGPDSFTQLFAGERLLYPLDYWNALACWSAMAVAIGLAWSAHFRSWQRRASLAAATVAGTVLYLTYSRAGIVAAALGIAIVIAGSRHRWTATVHAAALVSAVGLSALVIRGQPGIADGTSGEGAWVVALAVLFGAAACAAVAAITRRAGVDRLEVPPVAPRWLVLGVAAGAVAAAIALGPGLASRAEQSFAGPGYASSGSDPSSRLVGLEGSRSEVWSSAVRAFESSPLEGIGPGVFDLWWARDVAEGEDLRDAHSLYLETLAELGVPGLLAVVALLGGLVALAWRGRRAARSAREAGAATAMLAAGCVFVFHTGVDWFWEIPALTVLGLGVLAVGGAALSEPRRRQRRLGGGTLSLVLVAIAAGILQIPGVVAAERLRSSESLLAIGFDERASERVEEAIASQPWAAGPRAQRAFVALAAGDHEAARAYALEAVEREETNWRHRYLLLRIEVAAGNSEAALEALDEAVELNPSIAAQADRLRRGIERGRADLPELNPGDEP